MRIIRISRGFTTNSSGSYEWLVPSSTPGVSSTPDIFYGVSSSSTKVTEAVVARTAYSFREMTTFDWVLFSACVVIGLSCVVGLYIGNKRK